MLLPLAFALFGCTVAVFTMCLLISTRMREDAANRVETIEDAYSTSERGVWL